MRNCLGALAVIAAVLAAPAANAETWYIGGLGGLNYTHDGTVNGSGLKAEYDLGFVLGGFVGLYVQDNIRLEGELSYRTNDLDTAGGVSIGGEAETLALMANVFFDFKLESNVEPYLGAGIGFADVDYTVTGIQYNDTVLALQLIGGAGIEIAPATQLTVDYRLFLTDDVRVGSGVGFGRVEYTNSAFSVGIRRAF
jgi:opacity protein-like surface antigen